MKELESSERSFAHIKAEVFDKKRFSWFRSKGRIMKIERYHFQEGAYTPKQMKRDLMSENSDVVLLKDGRKVIGFIYALPFGFQKEEILDIYREDKGRDTAMIFDIALDPKYMGRHLTPFMLDELLRQLKMGRYRFYEWWVSEKNNFAGNISKNNQDNILVEGPTRDSVWGPQRFFRHKIV